MDKTINKILTTIDEAIDTFEKSVPGIQKSILEELQPLIKELEIKNGKILNNVDNLKLILNIKNKLEKIIISPDYKKQVQKFIDFFGIVTDLNNTYFSQFNNKFTPSKTLPILRQLTIETTINSLMGQGMVDSLVEPVRRILIQNITTGGSYAKFQEQLRNEIITNETGEGQLSKKTNYIVKDAISTYNRQYHKVMTDDLGFKWFRYVGSLLTTSREFCELLTAKDWVHISELPEIIKGKIDGKQCELNSKTKLPLGMKEDTNANNFQELVGGHGCRHDLYPVPDSAVPKDIRARIKE